MAELAACRAAPVMRIERVAEEAIARGLALGELRDEVRAEVAAARGRGFAGLKTIAAYRSGLDIGAPDPTAAAAALARAPQRLADKALLELLLDDALAANAASGDPLPVQVHCGFGDADLRLARADPALLGPLIERYRDTPFVLLHCYPFIRQAGWLAHVHANVFLDVSLTIPHVWRASEAIREALELAPGLQAPLRLGRRPHAGALLPRREGLARRRWPRCWPRRSRPDEAERAGRRVLRDNALALYRL